MNLTVHVMFTVHTYHNQNNISCNYHLRDEFRQRRIKYKKIRELN